MKIESIETERLYLRGFTREDARFAVGIWNDPEMGQYLPDAAMEEIDPEYLREIEKLGEDPDCCYLISEARDTHERIGTCSFIPSPDGRVYDIAYCVHKKFWRMGYATEMAWGMIDYAAGQGAARVTVSVGQENAASNAVVRKLGFRKVGESTYRKRGTDRCCRDYKYELVLQAEEG